MSQEQPDQPENAGDEEIVTGPAADLGAALDADMQKLQEERESLFNQLARVQADFKNAQKRLESEKIQAIQYANSRLIQALIPALDTFDRALEVDPAKTDSAAVLKGMQIVRDQLLKTLSDHHVTVIKPQPGEVFNPNLHQALMQQPDDRFNEPTVVQLYQNGYMCYERVLRPAQVVVGKKA
jgi:molecular chaperone GrpE